jgi:uncharacterized protein (TIGR03435 family)
MPGGGLNGVNVLPVTLISNAYDAAGYEIEGMPSWVRADRYDVTAKAAPGTSALQQKLMLQSLLEERFQLKTHRETKDAPAYFLTIAKSGSKLQPLKEGSCAVPDLTRPIAPPQPGDKPPCGLLRPGRSPTAQTLDSSGLTMALLAKTLGAMLGRTVIDRTGVNGQVDRLHLEFASARLDNSSNDSGPSIFTALEEQAGLKLESGKGPVEFLVIDHIEKPADN